MCPCFFWLREDLQIRMFRSTYERPDSPDLNYLDPEILSVTRNSAKEAAALLSPTKEQQSVTNASENDQELGTNTILLSDDPDGVIAHTHIVYICT